MAAPQDTALSDSTNRRLLIARRLGRSSILRLLAAVFVLALFIGLAWSAREYPDFAAKAMAAVLVIVGLRLTWNLLPLSAKTRVRMRDAYTRWQEEDQRLRDTWTRVFRNGLWFGPLMLLFHVFDDFWEAGTLRLPSSEAWFQAAMFFIVGLVAQLHYRLSNRGNSLGATDCPPRA